MDKNDNILSMLRFLARSLKEDKMKLFISFILLLGISFFEFNIPQITQKIIDQAIPQKSMSLIGYQVGLLLICAFFLSCLTYASTMIMSRLSQSMITQLRNDLYQHLLRLDFSFFENAKTGDLMTRLTSDVKTLQDLISPQSLKLISNLFTFIFIYGFMLFQDVILTLLITITFPLLYLLNLFFSKHIKQAFRKVRASTSEINNHLQNSLTSILLIKTFVNEKNESQTFKELNDRNKDNYIEAMSYQTIFAPSIDLVNYLGMAIVLLYSGYSITQGKQTIGELVAYLAYLKMLQTPIRSFTQMVSRFQQAVVSYNRIVELYDVKPTVIETKSPLRLSQIKEGIIFDQVNFSYSNGQPILKNVSFEIKQGKMTALVGVSGSGKTTITKLIERLYDVTSGCILIDSQPIQDYTLTSLRQHISLVTQDIELIDGTILENILYGSEGKTEIEVEHAVKAAKLADFISSLPDNIHTEVGERGIKLSGGQKQRIAIARTFLKNAPLLILDEATASLDNESERYIQASLDSLLSHRTSLVIAHRLSTIQKADQIIVMEDGQVVEIGTHETLLNKSGRYQKLYDAQFT
ncbi:MULTISPECIES: ABC transporter ATP-binding protein [Vagococcus]|uniref:Lipid A export ATP-binding/permease protein MsbA n=1 Tax=Vagococcus fluvialis bH819 TaxID=1255619 RepID=A0A1X6WPF4_9ENTE|nr:MULTISPECIES: ABC transporter ATP-binding protein [Vagococcus]SLM86194.1 Lipid A export ATP-binding/permease protein MsbA [Vagococcus fluvialis bH819]HCM89714.1 ABC transporter ATP-binding protein [Vagococcus sp.]